MMDCYWKNGKPNGQGTVVEDGQQQEVTWNNGEIVE